MQQPTGLITEEEHKKLQDFWIYCQPVDLYQVLATRQRQNPTFLNRTLCYHREARQSVDSLRHDTDRLRVTISCSDGAPLSLLAALCHRTAAEEFVPVSCSLLHVPLDEAGDVCEATADLGVPAMLHGRNGAQELSLLLLASAAHPDLRHIKSQHGARLTSRLLPQLAFGLLPAGDAVSWGYVPVPGAALASQQLLSLGSVQLSRGVLQVQRTSTPRSNGTARGASVLCCLFAAAPGQHASVTLNIQAAQGETPPVPMQVDDPKCYVFYQYFYHNGERHIVEKLPAWKCSFCLLRCRSFTGLQQHLEASHELFLFAFSADHPDVVPTVNVDVAPDVYNARGEFTQLDVDAYRQPANKEFYYACPRRQRALRVTQYEFQAAADPATTSKPQQAARPVFRTSLREPAARLLAHTDSVDDSTGSELQTGDSVPATRRKTSRTQLQLATAALQPETRYFHSLSCMPMTHEEAAAGGDSDEEPDIEAWRRRQREQLVDKVELSRAEKEFMLNWNAATHQRPIHGDLFMPDRVADFAREHARVFLRNAELRRAFVNFCIILWDYCVLTSEAVDTALKAIATAPANAAPAGTVGQSASTHQHD